jgi:hypothetical protein
MTMSEITEYLNRDHGRLDALLARATADPTRIDAEAYWDFRRRLLRHIALEERVLFPAVRRALAGPLPWMPRLKRDHGRLVAMMVPTPTPAHARDVRALLEAHNIVEEHAGGAYEECEAALSPAEAAEVLERLRATPEVPVLPYWDGPTAPERG